MRKRGIAAVLLSVLVAVLLHLGAANALADETLEPGAYNVIGLEDNDYQLSLAFVKRGEEFSLDDEKISFYMLGCDLVANSDGHTEFIMRSEELGAKMVFIAPEAGRQSGTYSTADFYSFANSILRIKSTDKLIFDKIGDQWRLTIGENDIDPDLYLEGKKSWNEKLKHTGGSDEPFMLNLENYTLSRAGEDFLMVHTFSPSSPLYDIEVDTTIEFVSHEIMLRTYETRLSAASNKSVIVVDRLPSQTIVGSIIRFTGDADDGDNLATITGIDRNTNQIFITRYDSVSYNTHPAGTWLRCYADGGNGQVYDNAYPRVNLEPTTWSFTGDQINALFNGIVAPYDITGLLGEIDLNLDDDDNFGYGLKNVTYAYDGLNFTGGLTGAFDINMDLDFFGRQVDVGPVHIDYTSMANSLLDEILRINTYKREAFRFYFNPKMFQSYCDWGGVLPNPPDVFPLTFRLYFDKQFGLIGGNIKLNVPGKGLPLPGGLAVVDTIGGGFTYPATFAVDAVFKDAGLDSFGVPFWNADVEAVLSLDRSYLTLDGRIWMWDSKFKVGDASATIAWSYYEGKRFKGIEFSGETGVGTKHVNLVFDLTFKVKRYQSSGVTKSYIGGSGSGKVEAFGVTFAGIGIKATTRKFCAYVNPPGPIGTKKVTVYYKNITKAVSSLSIDSGGLVNVNATGKGVATYNDEAGRSIVLIPEARKIPQDLLSVGRLNAHAMDVSTLNLPDASRQAAITINYTGRIDDISVALPGGGTSAVVIANENTVETPDTLYAMDYALDDTQRQLYIEINDADAGDYTLSYVADNVTDTSIYEISQVPEIENGDVNASYAGGIVDLGWNLAEAIDGDVKYHLTLQALTDGQVTAQYPVYENMVVDDDGDEDDDGEEVEIYVDDAALTVIGTSVSTRVRLPDSLASGTYAFVVEPVLNNADEDDIAGAAIASNTFAHTNSILGGIVQVPTGVMVENTGNGITRVRWDHDPLVYSWDVIIRDMAGSKIGATSILSENLVLGQNLSVDPLTLERYVYTNIAIDSNVFGTTIVPEAEYDTAYTFEVQAVQRVPQAGGSYYNNTLGYIDMNTIEADLNEGYLLYNAASAPTTGRFIESQGMNFYIEIYDKENENPVFLADLFEGDTGEIGYTYDVDSDLDVESLRQIDMGALVLRTNALDSFKLLPDQRVQKFGIAIRSPSGTELLNIPVLSLTAFTQPENWTAIATEIATSYPTLTADLIARLQQIYSSGAISLQSAGGIDDIHIDLSRLSSLGIIDSIEHGRYTVSVTVYNENSDRTVTDFEIVVRDILPAPFIDRITRVSGYSCRVVGFAGGAQTITINGSTAEVSDGMFDLTATIDSKQIEYEIVDEFGGTYSGTIEYNEYRDPAQSDSGGDHGCFIAVCVYDLMKWGRTKLSHCN
jgi:hypothetical protein